MHEIIRNLPAGAMALDLGSRSGSYDAAAFPFTTVRVDLERQLTASGARFVQADAARLPFRDGVFDALICNHGLEHFVELDAALGEIGRTLKPGACLYIAVPDASGLHDHFYRWFTFGGGHVNRFADAGRLAALIAERTGLPHFATKVLFGAFSYLNHRNISWPRPRRIRWLAVKREDALVVADAVLRLLDKLLHTRTSIYGWCMYFGRVPEPVDTRPWTNVCARCGQAHPSAWLDEIGATCRWWGLFPAYRCPGCGLVNLYGDDRDFERLA